MQLSRVKKDAARLVKNKGVLLPGIPQTLDRLQKLIRHFIAQIMGRMFRAAVPIVQGRTLQRRSNDIPAGPPAAEMVNGGKLAGDGKGFAVGGGQGGRQADMGGGHSQGRQQGQRLKAVEKDGMGLFADIEAVAEKYKIQLGRLGPAGQIPIVGQADRAVGRGGGMPPGGHIAPGAGKESPQAHLALCRHKVIPPFPAFRCRSPYSPVLPPIPLVSPP